MTKTFILGVDGLPCWLWSKFADCGVMPFSKQLLRTGQLVPMLSSMPEVSSTAWASIVTGKNPGGHNVYGFTDLIDGSYMLGFTSSRTFRAPPFWQIQDGRRNLIINSPQSYPALPMSGTLAAGFVALDLKKAIYPPDQLQLFEDIGYRVDADMGKIDISKDAFLQDLYQVLKTRVEAFDRLYKAEPWDTIMFVITETDRLNHYLWQDYEDASSPYHQKFLDFYHEVDCVVERIVSRLDDNVTLVAVSDHGFGCQELSVNVNKLLHEYGYLSLQKSERPSYGDMTRETTAFAMDPGRIYLHRKDRYPKGEVDAEQANILLDELRQLFAGLEVAGKRLVDRVLLGTEVYHGPYAHRAPDLILMAADGIALSGRMNLQDLVEPTLINGKHTWEQSTFFYRGAFSVEIPQPMRVEDVLGVLAQAEARRAAA